MGASRSGIDRPTLSKLPPAMGSGLEGNRSLGIDQHIQSAIENIFETIINEPVNVNFQGSH